MPEIQSVAIVILTGMETAALWLAWHFLWRRSCQEVLRQRLFSLRDELFDFALNGGIDFKEPAYVLVRASINSVIRFSHRISVTRLFIFIVFQRFIGNPEAGKSRKRIMSAISQCPRKEAKEALSSFHERMYSEIVRHILLASPQIVLLMPALAILDKIFSMQQPTSMDSATPLREKGAILIEAQAREAFHTERVARQAVLPVPA